MILPIGPVLPLWLAHHLAIYSHPKERGSIYLKA